MLEGGDVVYVLGGEWGRWEEGVPFDFHTLKKNQLPYSKMNNKYIKPFDFYTLKKTTTVLQNNQ